jgi:aminomethyltransferase
MLKRTPLYASHHALGARLIDFGGWEMPVQYTSISDEHNAVRKAAGIFDISHMGEFFVSGTAAQEFLNSALTNDVTKLSPGQGQYTLMCNERGGVVDDLYLYCLGLGNYLLIVNASRIEADFAWLQSVHEKYPNASKVKLEEKSDSYGAVAVQGPNVAKFIDAAIPSDQQPLSNLSKNEIRMVSFRGELIYAARTGYSGEDGFEIVAPSPLIDKVWTECLAAGKEQGIKPCGLGARDTLRLESCYPLYGHELNETSTPIEAGLGFFVALNKPSFTGAEVLRQQKTNGPQKRLVAFKMTGKSPPPRADYPIWSADGSEKIGVITSGTQSPTLGIGLGMGFVSAPHAAVDTNLQIEIRGNKFPAVVVKKPFYKRSSGL